VQYGQATPLERLRKRRGGYRDQSLKTLITCVQREREIESEGKGEEGEGERLREMRVREN